MNKYSLLKKLTLIFTGLLPACTPLLAAGPQAAATAGSTSISPEILLRYTLAGVILLMVLIIIVLSNAVKLAGKAYQDKFKSNQSAKALTILLFLGLSSTPLFAQRAPAAPSANSFSQWDVYLFMVVIVLLFIVMLVLVRSLFVLMGVRRHVIEHEHHVEGKPVKVRTWFQRFNNTVGIEDEASLDMSHDYDGIRELDNKVPAWWNWAFITSILFAAVYLYRMFVTQTLPNQETELATANEMAAEAKLAYLKKGANNVDENTVKMLDAAGIAEGAALFGKNCVPCHGDRGQGNTVGPNLTDDYWIHKGGIQNIFYSIKYGWAEKGMKSWKEDFSPGQIAQLASFVKSLRGSNPPGAKEKQGELYVEDGATAPAGAKDSSAAPASSAPTKYSAVNKK